VPFIDRLEKGKQPCSKIEKDFLTGFDLERVLVDLRIPVLNVFGDSDIRVPVRTLVPYAKLGLDVENFSLPHSGHYPFLREESRGRLVEKLRRWLATGG
jgi:hypothetical protein